jgi:glycosyltransferase involved in cell wall biosynthesis
VSASETLLFISPRFLFPVDSGGKIRTTQTLRGLKGGRFKVRLASPASAQLVQRFAGELNSVCDEFVWWPLPATGPMDKVLRLRHLTKSIPIPVATDNVPEAAACVARELQRQPSAVVFDFVHAAVLAPQATLLTPSVLFTHNVEAEIFERHRQVAGSPLMKALWKNQHAKMHAFEAQALRRFDVVVAVSQRDASKFTADYGIAAAHVIPTGVDLEFFAFHEPQRARDIVFCGSMDWLANQDGVQFFMDQIWPRIVAEVPDARMTVVGRSPPGNLVEATRNRGWAWKFTGYVDDVRPHIEGAAVSVIPLRIGGGTRLKVFESMAMGPAVMSTAIGVEGLPVESGRNCLLADDPVEFAQKTVSLLRDAPLRLRLSRAAREYVEAHFGFRVAAQSFEQACALAIDRHHDAGTADPRAARLGGVLP